MVIQKVHPPSEVGEGGVEKVNKNEHFPSVCVCMAGGESLKTNIRFVHLSIFILISEVSVSSQLSRNHCYRKEHISQELQGGSGTKSVEHMRLKYPGCPGQN